MSGRDAMAAEQSVIGGCLLDNEAYWRVAGTLVESDFTSAFNRRCWTAIQKAANAGDGFDAVTLSETTDLDLGELLTLANETPGAANIEAYARIVQERSIARMATTVVTRAASRLSAGEIDGVIPDLQSQLERLNRTERPSVNFHEALAGGLDAIEAAQKARDADGLSGAPTGIPPLDYRLGGLSGPKLIILAARPSLGKTALVLQVAQAAAGAGFPVGIMSLEMSADEIALRAFAHQMQLNNSALAAGDKETVEKMARKFASDPDRVTAVKTLPIHIDEDSYSLPAITARISEWKRKHGIQLAIIDHLQLVEIGEGQNRNDGLGEITRQLKILAKRLDMPIILLCQLNRSVERENRKPKLSDLRDSGNIEQDADIVLALHGDIEVDRGGMRDVEIGWLKFRGGVVGWQCTLKFNGPTQTFRQIDYYHEERP